ncbi:glycosyltransferase family 4 protein [Cellulomonas sp. URHE0023]|uniref:glycosyltransferase family 4 protein n=1 Tax=Cellulomonas sp. URHE0023 TaxID=1380354 RepID=UPI000B23E1DE|nr:glycosyltransferase family 4 protein [Cellulomonas sp. URHE0023]
MRIAVVYDCLFPVTTGGGERQYRAFAETFADEGWSVEYLTRRQWEQEPPYVPGVDVVAVSPSFRLYDDTGNRRPLPALGFAWGVLRYVRKHRREYDAVLVSALPVLNVFAVRLALAGTRVPVCADFLEVWRRDQWLEYSGPVMGRVANALQRWAVRASPLVSAHSRMNGDRLVALRARRAPVVSPGLIDARDVPPAQLVAGEPPTVVYVGRHIPDKRVESIPAAVAWAREAVPNLQAVILGDGEQRAAVEAEVQRLGLQDVVAMPGFVDQDVLDGAMRDAAVLVNPSRREGYGLAVVEACAAGTPVVLAQAPDNASVELVEEGINGFVAASERPDDLGAAIVAVVDGGPRLRATTRHWFDEAVRTRTVQAAARGILAALTEAGAKSGDRWRR